ncbi:MAG: hypothetical protein MJ240_00625 [Kiritimatiellae bacterium]|nr:hypothetical protein [Kiritimatiellia bacterium]
MNGLAKLKIFVGCVLLAVGAYAVEVMSSQMVALNNGWNAFYLTVSPTGTADQVFADWPVDFVSAYDSAAFLETRQYSALGSTEGTSIGGYRTWHRLEKGASSLMRVPANTVYVCFATNVMPARTIYGRPSAPRITWHASSTNESLNLVGLSTYAPATLSGYFNGLDVGNTFFKQFYGSNPAAVQQHAVYDRLALDGGAVLLVDSSKVSDWSGVLNVSPVGGIDFGTNGTMAAVQVRNDGLLERTVRVALVGGSAANALDVPPMPTGLQIKDVSTAMASATNAWTAFLPATPFVKRLKPSETLNLRLALDRSQLEGAAGTYYGALLLITDEDGGSNMKVAVPVEAIGDGGAFAQTAWPKGIWLAAAELDTVTFVGTPIPVTNETVTVSNVIDAITKESYVMTNYHSEVRTSIPTTEQHAGGKMKVRLPLYVDGNGGMTLLQRFWYGRDAAGALHVIAGSANSDVPLTETRRVSTAFLPTDQVKIPAASGAFGTTATFPFVVAETSNVNPMRHALHPQHDGKRFDFKTPSPSGDDLDNYQGTIKPESFSITNTVNFTWKTSQGTTWSPDETLSGRLIWEFGGLRHEGTIRASGPFVMKRIGAVSLEK